MADLEQVEWERWRKKRYVPRGAFLAGTPHAMTGRNGGIRDGRHQYHDVVDTKTGRVAFKDAHGTIDHAMASKIARALNAGGKPPKFCPKCGGPIE